MRGKSLRDCVNLPLKVVQSRQREWVLVQPHLQLVHQILLEVDRWTGMQRVGLWVKERWMILCHWVRFDFLARGNDYPPPSGCSTTISSVRFASCPPYIGSLSLSFPGAADMSCVTTFPVASGSPPPGVGTRKDILGVDMVVSRDA